MTSEVEKLTAQIEANKSRRVRRKAAADKDWEEYIRLTQLLERATAKTLKGQTVVLNPNRSIGDIRLRKLRGMTATVTNIGTKYIRVVFSNGDAWRVNFDDVVLATPENSKNTDGELLDSVALKLNAALGQ